MHRRIHRAGLPILAFLFRQLCFKKGLVGAIVDICIQFPQTRHAESRFSEDDRQQSHVEIQFLIFTCLPPDRLQEHYLVTNLSVMASALDPHIELTSLKVTHVYYNPADPLSLISAYLALLPQALMVIYVTLIYARREIEIVLMFGGQLFCELTNWTLKRLIKEERPKRNPSVMGRT